MFIDQILKETRENRDQLELNQRQVLDYLSQAEVILADNVANFYYCETDQEYWDLEVDFPNAAPIFPEIFVEYTMPNHILSEEYGTFENSSGIKKQGILIVSKEVDSDDLPNKIPERLRGIARQYIKDNRVRWVSVGFAFFRSNDGILFLPHHSTSYLVREDGSIYLPDGKTMVSIFTKDLAKAAETHLDVGEFVRNSGFLHIALLTLSFIHCRNTSLKTVTPNEKLNKARMKRGSPSLVVYKILEIQPLKKILEIEGESSSQGLKKALHICRGHFKDYTIGKGLFGKVHGLFWWDMALRGSNEVGAILKDYRTDVLLKGIK